MINDNDGVNACQMDVIVVVNMTAQASILVFQHLSYFKSSCLLPETVICYRHLGIGGDIVSRVTPAEATSSWLYYLLMVIKAEKAADFRLEGNMSSSFHLGRYVLENTSYSLVNRCSQATLYVSQ